MTTLKKSIGQQNSVGKIAKKAIRRSAFLLIRHSKYILSKIHSYRLLFQEYNHMKKINRITECRNENNQQKKVRLIKCITP